MLSLTGLIIHEGDRTDGTGTERTRNGHIQRTFGSEIKKAQGGCWTVYRSSCRANQQEWAHDEAEHVSSLGDSENFTAMGCGSSDCKGPESSSQGVDTAEIILRNFLQIVRIYLYSRLTICNTWLSRLSDNQNKSHPMWYRSNVTP